MRYIREMKMKEVLCDYEKSEMEAYRNTIRYCIKDIENSGILKDLSQITQECWQNEKRHGSDQDAPGG